MRRIIVLLFVLTGLRPGAGRAQAVARTVRLADPETRSVAAFARIHAVRATNQGLLVAHGGAVSWVDSTLTRQFDVLEAEPGFGGERGRALIPWHGDSTLLVDARARWLGVVDGSGVIAREIDIPVPLIAACLAGRAATPALDASGRLLCQMPPDMRNAGPVDAESFGMIEVADTSPLVRIAIGSWDADTIAYVGSGRTIMAITDMGGGHYALAPLIDPLPLVDDWTVSAGRLGIVRGANYRVDWLDPATGATVASVALPYEPVPLDAARKSAVLDSARRALELVRYATSPGTFGQTWPPPSRDPIAKSAIAGLTLVLPAMARDPQAMAASPGREPPPLQYVDAGDLPDRLPPFRPGSVRADADGNLWIRTSRSTGGGVLHHIVPANGGPVLELVVPADRTVVGFAPGGSVYLSVSDAGTYRLERARLVR